MFLLVLLQLMMVGFELIGVGMLLPVFEQMRVGGETSAPEGTHWDALRNIAGFLGVEITLGLLLLVSFVFILLRQAFHYAAVLLRNSISRRTINKVRSRAFIGFLRADSAVQREMPVGELANDVTVELDRSIKALFTVFRSLSAAVQIAAYFAGLFFLSPVMTVFTLTIVGIVGLLSTHLRKGIRQTAKGITDANVEMTAFIVARLQNARLIRLSGMEQAEGKAFSSLSSKQSEQTFRQKAIETQMGLLPEPIAVGFGYTTLFVGGHLLGMSLATLAVFVVVLIRLVPVVKQAMLMYSVIMGNWASVQRVDAQLSKIDEAREEPGGGETFQRLENGISYDSVVFSYSADQAPALNDVTLLFPAHRMSALVGPSGAGKSTLVDLLPRIQKPSSGRILFDGVPVSKFSMESLRAGIAFVPQQPQVFDTTVAEHIRYGKTDATDEEVEEAAKLAGIADFVRTLPAGYNTRLGGHGGRLSGGQRQRLDIARALVRRAPILILDEPTSALDADAEAAFRDALQDLRGKTNLTIIVIAHRLSTVADADHIVVLRDGHVEAAGSHKELVKRGGWYASAIRKQKTAGARVDSL